MRAAEEETAARRQEGGQRESRQEGGTEDDHKRTALNYSKNQAANDGDAARNVAHEACAKLISSQLDSWPADVRNNLLKYTEVVAFLRDTPKSVVSTSASTLIKSTQQHPALATDGETASLTNGTPNKQFDPLRLEII